MPKPLAASAQKITHTVYAIFEEDAAAVIAGAKGGHATYLGARNFTARAGSLIVLPAADGKGEALTAWFGLGPRSAYTPMTFRALPSQLPRGMWTLKADEGLDRTAIHLAWSLGSYGFNRYKSNAKPGEVELDGSGLTPDERLALDHEFQAHDRVRNMVNTPANDLGPAEIADIARGIAETHGADVNVIVGDELLTENYPAVHAVGCAASPDHAPRFIEIAWDGSGVANAPTVVLVGKGVAFDTGGLNIKTGGGMGLMKKDMGGAAHALALGEWIMASGLPVKLHILIAAVENSISGAAMRPGDVLASRAGLSIEVGNTDAEGRLILADALARAGELEPHLTLDFATLTGAARVALGPEVVPFYCDDEDIVRRLEVASIARNDPLWRMPLWAGYRDALDSDIADIKNDPSGWAQAGSVTAALFLQRFAPSTGAWVHFDLYAWNPRGKAGSPVGAEVQTLRAVYHLIKDL